MIGISLAIETAIIHPLWNIPMDSNAVVWDYPDTVVLIWACLFEPASTLKCSQQVTQAELCFQYQETPLTGESSSFQSFFHPWNITKGIYSVLNYRRLVLIISPHRISMQCSPKLWSSSAQGWRNICCSVRLKDLDTIRVTEEWICADYQSCMCTDKIQRMRESDI